MLYSHPTLGDMTAEQLHLRIKQKQDQRLIAAIQAQSLRATKIEKLAVKDRTSFQKVGDRLVTRLAKAAEMLEKCEDDLMTMQKLSNQLSLYDDELGN